ncbi:UDPGP type 1 family protein [Verrucomicrobiales bacterium]|nr:UDPGP type 1 family protein [Verrucomicrobiales bacterium]MDC0258695.1 UDPGP type 1 family protein [Verrucomicrobiales bacterium]MDC0314271.1 UDPGP type 1 family protein [bacterium]
MSHPNEVFIANGQSHVFQFHDELNAEGQAQLKDQASAIDLAEIDRLVETLVRSNNGGNDAIAEDLEPAPFIPLPKNGGDSGQWQRARKAGEQALRDGRVAAFVVAGGQGTRLGFDAPKGTFPVTPVEKKSLFQVFAEKILAAGIEFGKPVPWFIMTSIINHDNTIAYFEKHNFFGLAADQVQFFSQGLMSAVDANGKILLADKDSIALSPDGHGGSLRALVRSGAIDKMKAAGIDTISYFQVDNPLVRCIDPEFIGFHLLANSELSSKALPKRDAGEKVGVFCEKNGESVVIEYSDMPERLASERDANGELRFRGGSIAIHIFNRDLVERLGSGNAEIALPFHLAHKKVAHIDPATGEKTEPAEPNAYKFEMFVFDALPFAENPVIIETAREDDFSPVKNAEGSDSPQTSADDQLRQFARWAKAAGIEIEADDSGLPAVKFEVSPLFADTQDRFVKKWNALSEKPAIADGTVIS